MEQNANGPFKDESLVNYRDSPGRVGGLTSLRFTFRTSAGRGTVHFETAPCTHQSSPQRKLQKRKLVSSWELQGPPPGEVHRADGKYQL